MVLPTTMKVVHQVDPHTDELVLEESPLPATSESHAYLIRVYAISPCLGELTWEANFPQLFAPGRERVPGTECSGVVVSGPAGPTAAFHVGDEVFFRAQPTSTGCLREYTVVPESWMALKPKALNWVEAAATPLSSLTAYQGLFEHGGLDRAALLGDAKAREANSKKRVLVSGAGGGVGGWGVQLAAAAGTGAVVATCGASDVEAVKKLGATDVIVYSKQSIPEWVAEDPAVRECDLVLDCVGKTTLEGGWAAAKEGGMFFSIVGDPNSAKPEGLNKTLAKAAWFLVEPSGADLKVVAKLVEEGKCAPKIDSVYEFTDFDQAFKKVHGGRTKGKVVIKVAA